MSRHNFILYKVKNSKNGKVYIGATSSSVRERKLDHESKSTKLKLNKFHEAISTFGAEAFIWAQLDTANSFNDLAQKERQYILKFNSKEKGYNADSGGGFKKTVYQYGLKDGNLVNTFNNLEEAGDSVEGIKQQISRACLSTNKTFRGFYWSYEYKEPFRPELDNRTKIVQQFDLNGTYLQEYKSVSEASIITGCNKSSIAKVCRGKRNHAGGFIWKYK